METKNFEIAAEQSNINWVGRKVTGAHNGTIAIKEGSLTLTDSKLSKGNFIIDTTSIKILDITDPATNAQFGGHLASDDFFSSEKYPEAVFLITSLNGDRINGDLTIKGITNTVTFPAKIEVKDGIVKANGKLVIDRTQWGIRYRSGKFYDNLADQTVSDDIEIHMKIIAKK